MALADYFRRSAVAASQALGGYDEAAIASRLDDVVVELAVGSSMQTAEGRALADLTMRLAARLYPRVSLTGASTAGLADLAQHINPGIELVDGGATHAVVIGDGESSAQSRTYAGSDGWLAHVSTSDARHTGDSANPFGAGAAACLSLSRVFRLVFAPDTAQDDGEVNFSTTPFEDVAAHRFDSKLALPESTVLVGFGAVGNGALWALDRASFSGVLHVVDPEPIELGNLQRYVLAARADEGRIKVELAASVSSIVRAHQMSWDDFVSREGYVWDRVAVALDSRRDRQRVQATLPRWITNAWTQPGDLGVSTHPWDTESACLACLYLSHGTTPNEDQLLAETFRLPHAEVGQELRVILQTNGSAPRALLERIAEGLGVPIEVVLEYEHRPLRDLYVGVCGGAVISLSELGAPRQDVHVPLAHQSALAGVLLAARLAGDIVGTDTHLSAATRIDVLKAPPAEPTQPLAKDDRGICLCQDLDYQAAWRAKYESC